MPRSRITADYATLNLQTQITSITDRLTGFISGLTISRTTGTTFTVAAGSSRNENGGTSRLMGLLTAMTKSLSPWAIGTNNGSLDTGGIAADTWYHVHQIRRESDAAQDILLSLSPTSPTVPSGWLARRRIGSIRTDVSSNIINFSQNGDVFLWDVPVVDVSSVNPGTSAVNRTLTVPTGVIVFPIASWHIQNATTAAIQMLITPLTVADTAPTSSLFTLATAGVINAAATVVLTTVPTNTSAAVRTRVSASGASDTFRTTTLGWIDTRGR